METGIRVNIADVSPIRKKLEVEIAPEVVSREIGAFLKRLKREVTIRGFRPGRAPIGLLKSRYRDHLEEEVSSKLIDESLQKIVEENEIRAVGNPQIDREGLKEGEAFKFSALVDIRPEPEVKDHSGLELTRRVRNVTPDVVQVRLEQLRTSEARVKALEEDRGIASDDLVIANVDVRLEDRSLRGYPVSDFGIFMGEGDFPPQVEAALIGARPGEARAVSVAHPDDYREPQLKGKEVQYQITVKEIKEVVRPDLSDDLARDLGYQTLDELKEKVAQSISEEQERASRNDLKRQVKEQLVLANLFEVPPSMVEAQVEREMALLVRGLPGGESRMDREEVGQRLLPGAEKEIRAQLILEAIARKEGIEITDEEVEREYQRLATETRQNVEVIRKNYVKGGLVDGLRRRLAAEVALEKVIEKAHVKEERLGDDPDTHSSRVDQ